MKYRKVEGTDLNISEVSLGTWVFGGNHWSGIDEDLAEKTVLKAIDSGVNLIDTAPIYGDGNSEEIIGRAIKGRRKEVLIATKCGLVPKDNTIVHNLKPSSIFKEVEDSLRRLQTDHIDIYQLHWPDEATPLEDTFGAMTKLKEQGKIRYVGVSNFSLELLKKAVSICKITTIQNEYSFLRRENAESVLDYCHLNNIGFMAYGPLAGGILSGKYLGKPQPTFKGMDARKFFYKFYKGDGFVKANKVAKTFADIAASHGKDTAQAALNWVLSRKGVTTILSGARAPEQIEQNVKSSDWELPAEDLQKLEKVKI
jgi:methylglyoxal reductase